ncbi:helix-turn-helix domain-containing protein [Enterococcus sp.]|uniref:helix-turn-helix domain-containing protein n=1 Tax=Enterococcus sp. TaxID=35783 RepID=UPI003C751DBE
MTSLPKKIIDLRESNDWSQAELARRLDVNKSVMNRIESGERKVSSDELKRLSDIFDVSTDYLLECTGEKDKTPNLVAAHLDDDVSDEDMEDILNYIEFRKKNPLGKKK